MNNDTIDLLNLRVSSFNELKDIRLEVALLQNNPDNVYSLARLIETSTLWNVRPFSKYEHAIDVLATWTPHIFITHWHLGWDHRANNQITNLVNRFRETRGAPGVGRGPFLVGTYRSDADYFHHENFLDFLNQTYDYHIESLVFDFDRFLTSIIQHLWQMLPTVLKDVSIRTDLSGADYPETFSDSVLLSKELQDIDFNERETLDVIEEEGPEPRDVAFSSDESMVAIAIRNNDYVQLVNIKSGKVTPLGENTKRNSHPESICVPASRQGQIAIGYYGEWSVYDLESGQTLFRPECERGNWVNAIEASPDGQWWGVVVGTHVSIYSTKMGKVAYDIGSSLAWPAISMSYDGSIFAYAYLGGWIAICDVRSGQEIDRFQTGIGRGNEMVHLSFHPNKSILSVCCEKTGDALLRDFHNKRLLPAPWASSNCLRVDFSPTETRVALQKERGGVLIRDVEGKGSITLKKSTSERPFWSAKWSHSGQYLAVANGVESWVRVWSTITGRCVLDLNY
jgi:WD40 repeat protein